MNDTVAIVLNYNSWENTIQEVCSLQNEFLFGESNIIIVDNCSSDESAKKLIENASGKYVFIQSDKNGGYAYGNNMGLRYAKKMGYKYALILNNDILFEDKDMIIKMKQIMNKDQTVAVVNPDVYDIHGRLYNRNAVRYNFLNMTIGSVLYKITGRKICNLGGYGYIYRPQGCCMLVDLDKIDEIGYLDENTFLYSEESILAERLLKKNYRCACCVDTKIVHNHSQTVKKSINKKKVIDIQLHSFRYYLQRYRKYSKLKISICCFFYKCKLWMLS